MHSKHILVAALALSASASAQQLQVIYCKIPTSAKSVVPGALDNLTGLPEATNFRALEDLYLSPDGSRWVVKGRTQQGSDEETILMMGSGTSGTMFAQEGQPVPAGLPGEVIDFFGSGGGRFNTANQFAYSLRARGGVAANFQKVVVWDGVNSTMQTQMGDLYTGLIDDAPALSGDETVGNSIGSIHLLDDGRVGAQDSTIGLIHTSNRPAIFYNNAAFHQADVTTITNLAGSGTLVCDGVSGNTFYTSPDGAHWIAIMDIDPTTGSNNSLVYDGQVVVENNQIIPGTAITCGSIFASEILADGTWFARGRDNSGTSATAPDWALRNGVLLAKTGDVISGAETYGDTFGALTGNANGDWAMTANTSEPLANRNEVIVVNGQVVVREGDPVDVDGNGLFDDGAFLGRATATLSCFQPNDLSLTNDNKLFFFATLNDGAGNDLNSNPTFGTPDVFIMVDLGPNCGAGVVYCTAGTTSNGCVPSISGIGSASGSAPSGFTINIQNVEGGKLGLIFYGVNGAHAAPWGAGSSFLCVKAPTMRTPAQNSGGTAGQCDGVLARDWNAFIFANPGALGTPFSGGETVWAQGWFRDPPASKTTNLSDGLRFTVCP